MTSRHSFNKNEHFIEGEIKDFMLMLRLILLSKTMTKNKSTFFLGQKQNNKIKTFV